ncbi:hypothetical protein PRUPE_4G251600 [Prunus persica]|uniref:Uncharacterized protein n=1 Tax=Prunus persica TaxID=3760 RepID=A0A251PQP6_PRUPE|nr:uncharacterized protein LOC18781461 [Prunus persica]ONI13878.1 hypothetical protein PRUPE_4G251600 [Prunus persica]
MAESRDDPEFYLPTHFLTDDVVLHNMDDNSFHQNGVGSVARFPTEFPYEFDSSDSNSALSSAVESVVGSTETESSDEEDFLSGLTRRLAQSSLQQTRRLSTQVVWAFRRTGAVHLVSEAEVQFQLL